MGEFMKGYKAFKKGLVCRDKQYAENTVFEEKEAVVCRKGMHFCEYPLDVFDYYPLIDENGDFSEFAEVEALDEAKTDDNKKFCTTKLKVGAKISFENFIKSAFHITYEKIKKEAKEATKDCEAGGDSAKLAGGYSATLAGGDYAKLAGGYSATLAGGNSATLAGGDYATLAGGDYATLAGGKNSIMVGGHRSVAKGGKGSVIVLVERDFCNNIKNFRAEMVDGEKIKEDTFYKLVDGEFKEVKENK